MIKKVLIANRGEIAVRIIRTCKIMGIKTVLAYSACDKDTLAVFMADEAVCLGDSEPQKSYLNIAAIISAAEQTGCDAVHPGYGFLSESADFAEEITKHGFLFIGPSCDVLRKTADKFLMKKIASSLSIPTIPLTDDKNRRYPLLIKTKFGGGGRGIKLARNEQEYEANMKLVKQEAINGFKNGDYFLEQVIDAYKHIDIQFVVDRNRKITIFPPRDCSVQCRRQKIIEETPATNVPKKLLEQLARDAVKIISATKYDNVGTVEFLLDKGMNYYFLEINSRLQVEHTITEEATGIDLVMQQILLADGNDNALPEKVVAKKHTIECRVITKAAGELNIFNMPSGKDTRVDTFVYQGYAVKPFYDPLIMKIIVSDVDRARAISKMQMALDETIVRNIPTNVDELYGIISSREYMNGKYSFFEELQE